MRGRLAPVLARELPCGDRLSPCAIHRVEILRFGGKLISPCDRWSRPANGPFLSQGTHTAYTLTSSRPAWKCGRLRSGGDARFSCAARSWRSLCESLPILPLDLPRPAFLSRYNATMQDQPKSLPSEQEIAAIRLSWPANEFRRRTNASSEGLNLARSSDVYWYQPTVNLTLDGAPT